MPEAAFKQLEVPRTPWTEWQGMGFRGLPIAIICCAATQLLVFCLWTFVWRAACSRYKVWTGWSWTAFSCSRLGTFAAVAIPIALASIAESWGTKIMTLASGYSGADAVSAMHILNLIQGMLKSVISGIGSSIQVRVA